MSNNTDKQPEYEEAEEEIISPNAKALEAGASSSVAVAAQSASHDPTNTNYIPARFPNERPHAVISKS